MNMQERMIDRRTFRIAGFALAAAAVLVIAAYLFGARLRADTSASVAPSPLGSSLTDVRQARAVAPSALGANSLDARGARTIVSAAKAASLAALAKSRSDFYADLNNSGAAAAAPAMTLGASHYARLGSLTAAEAAILGNIAPATAADPYQNEWMGVISPESVRPSSAAADPYQNEWMGFTSPESVEAKSSAASYSARAAGLWFDIPAAGTRAGQSKSSAGSAGASSAAAEAALQRMIESSGAADYSERAAGLWFDIPAAGTRAGQSKSSAGSAGASSAANPSTSIKPEGINPSAAVDSAAKQLPWIKPEGIKASGAK